MRLSFSGALRSGVVPEVTRDVNVAVLQRSIVIWEEMMNAYKGNMTQIRQDHKLTWFFRYNYWKNERYYAKSFVALIHRRIELQTAIKQKESAAK